jgi:DNA repair protein RadC
MTSRVLRERTVFESSYYHTTIKQWPAGERPREKLLSHGAASLTEAELLAILREEFFREIHRSDTSGS